MIVRVLFGIVTLVALLGVVGYLVLAHPAASTYLVGEIDSRLGPALKLEQVSGSLLGELCVGRAEYIHERVTVRAEALCVRANLWRSIDHLSVSLESIGARLLEIRTHPGAGDDGGAGGELELPIPVEVSRVTVAELRIDDARVDSLRASVDLSNRNLRSTSRFRFQERDWLLATSGSWNALTGRLTVDEIQLEARVDLTRADLPYAVTGSAARVDLAELVDRPLVLDGLSLSGGGNTAGYLFDARFGVSDPLGSGRFQVSAMGDWEGLVLNSASVRSASVPTLDLTLDSLTGEAALDWSVEWRLVLEDLVVSGTLADQPLFVDLGRAELDAQSVRLQRAMIRPGPGIGAADAELRLDGRVGMDRTLDLVLEGQGLPLELIDGRAGGWASASATVQGTIERPSLAGKFAIDTASYGETAIGTVSGEVHGGLEEGRLAVQLEAPELALETALTYRLDLQRQRFSIGRARLLVHETPIGRIEVGLRNPVEVSVADGLVSAPESCFTVTALDESGPAPVTLCAEGTYPGGPVRMRVPQWQFSEWPIDDTRVSLSGTAAAEASFGQLDPPVGSVRLDLTELVAHHQDVPSLSLGATQLMLNLTESRGELLIEAPSDQRLVVGGAVTAELLPELLESPIVGRINAALDGIWMAEALLPMDVAFELDRIRGRLTVDTELRGTLGEPMPSGTLALVDAGWDVVVTNTVFDDFDLAAAITAGQPISFDSSAVVGDGSLIVGGELDLFGDPGAKLDASFRVDTARVVDLPDYSLTVGGAVDLKMTSDELRLAGELNIPDAMFRVAELPETAQTTSEDEVLVGDDTGRIQQIRYTDLRVNLGERVEFDAFGLKARLSGNLHLLERPGKPQELSGLITLSDGVFEAYGQTLTVERGQLTFSGPADDPLVDVVASKVVTWEDRDYKISLVITGTAQNLVTTLRSSPSVPDEDALALLIAGRTFSQISNTEQTNVSGAALSMGLLSATGITGNLATSLGLEEIIVDQDAEGNMEVGAAVRLNRDVYLRYTYGVFSRLGGVLLRYRLNNRFSVQAKTGDAHSIEIRYGVDD